MIAVPKRSRISRKSDEHLRLHGDVQRGGRLIRDQHFRPADQRHGDGDALPHAARKLMRILPHAAFGFGDVHGLQHFDRLRGGGGAIGTAVHAQRFGQLEADGEIRIQRGHRILKDEADFARRGSG